jgi:hypothetical protein
MAGKMPNYPIIATDWPGLELIPMDGLQFWHGFQDQVSTSSSVLDYSGLDRHLVAAGADPPSLNYNLNNGQPGWYFDGTNDPLTYSEPGIILRHVFVFAAFEETAFGTNRGLLTGPASGSVLVSKNDGSDDFYNFYPGSDVTYKKSNAVYPEASMAAPIGLVPELMEWQRPSAVVMDGIQVGQQLADASRKFKGWWFGQMGWDRVLDYEEIRGVHLFWNLQQRAFRRGVPLYFPSGDIVPAELVGPSRFIQIPRNWSDITQTKTYEDKGTDLNEIASDMPRVWDYAYDGLDKQKVLIFDLFNDAARRGSKV